MWEKTNKKSFANFHFQAKALLGFIIIISIVVGSFGVRADVPGGITTIPRLFETLKLRVVKKLWSAQGVKGDLIDQLIMSRILGLILLFTDSKIFPLLVILICVDVLLLI